MNQPKDETTAQESVDGPPTSTQEHCDKCRFCGVLTQYGHFQWCKLTRAPTGAEIAQEIVHEYDSSVDEGPSSDLADMAKAYLRFQTERSAQGLERVRNIHVGWEGTALGIDPEDSSRTLVRYDNGEIRATLTNALAPE